MFWGLSLGLGLLAAGCTGAGPGGNVLATVNGTFNGSTFTVGDAIYAPSMTTTQGSNTAVGITSFGAACTAVQQNNTVPNGKTLAFLLANYDASTGAVSAITAPGTIPVYAPTSPPTASGPEAIALIAADDASCNQTTTAFGASGSVTVSAVNSGGIIAKFDVTMSNGDHLTGSFDAPSCAALANPPSGQGTCH
jgi:hypothetical protein